MTTIIDNFLALIKKYRFQLIPLSAAHNGVCDCGRINCPSPAKHPIKNFRWKSLASSDHQQIQEWWSQLGTINIGLATGRWCSVKQRYLVVLDVDKEEHPILQILPKTLHYKTGKKGHHFWFWSKKPIPNSVNQLMEKIDIRGTGGYVVIPPSTHVNGNEYSFEGDLTEEIEEIPEWIVETLGKVTKQILKKTKVSPLRAATKNLSHAWAKMSITQMKDLLAKGNKIPNGIRNATIHRLLSSERAKGALKLDLLKTGKKLLRQIEDPLTFSIKELNQIVGSVMKYPAYNNSHEKVNDIYCKWVKKRGIKLQNNYCEDLKKQDDIFFKSLKPLAKGGIALSSLKTIREEFLKRKGLNHLSSYKDSLLAQKLKELGFTRTRTAKGNLWNVEFEEKEHEVNQPKRKKNKREIYYPGASNREFQEKLMSALNSSEEEQRKAYKDFLDSLLPGDEFGLGFSIYKEVEKLPNGQIVAKNPSGVVVTFGFDDMAMAPMYCVAGLAEILYRNNEPFVRDQ